MKCQADQMTWPHIFALKWKRWVGWLKIANIRTLGARTICQLATLPMASTYADVKGKLT